MPHHPLRSLTITKVYATVCVPPHSAHPRDLRYANTLLTNLNSRARIQKDSPKVHISLGTLEHTGASQSSGPTAVNLGASDAYELPSLHDKTHEFNQSIASMP